MHDFDVAILKVESILGRHRKGLLVILRARNGPVKALPGACVTGSRKNHLQQNAH